ncbi:endonuclease domain-containing protein [Siccirubricoccus phaeus]|uniref:endonuclease domain-containing protein n=1 Tax=Siccirubricoccus phaeus TaxID=2595053 RepID=UPI0022A6B2C7|nr:endonuclease domain-containing protein [Siccirubricoccus phaeus]
MPPYVADFACVSARLVVEIDGWTHADPVADVEREAALHAQGWHVLRFWNNEVMANPEGVVQAIQAALARHLSPPP